MTDFSDDEEPLPALGDFLNDSVDELEVSIGDLSIDDQGQTSTPKRGRYILKSLEEASGARGGEVVGGKHDLTPSSKIAILPQAKRFEVGGRPSGREVKERRGKLELTLKDGFEVREGSEVSVQSVLAYLGLDDDSQKLVSRVVKEIFPGIEMRREDKKGIKQTYYVNLAMKYNIATLVTGEKAPVVNDELTHLLQNLETSEQVISQIWSALVEANNKENDLTTLIMEYTREARTRDNLLRSLINVYESEIARLKSDISKDHLSSHQKATIRQEMKVLETLCDLNTRDGSEAFDSVTPALFQEFTKAVQENCPFIHEVIEALVVSNLHERNVYKTNSHKMLCSFLSLQCLDKMRYSTTTSNGVIKKDPESSRK